MVDFTTPNLCGASEQFNKLAGQFASIKDELQGQLEGEIDALKSELTSSLSVLEADIKGLIPELPDIPDISLISEVQNFLALPAGSSASLNALTSLTSQFGAGLAAAGQDLDSLISSASSALSGGIDLCGGTIPNFVIGPNGIPTLKPEDSGMPDTDPERVDEDGKILPEPPSSLSTAAAEISASNASLSSAVSAAAEKIKETAKEITVDISAERGNISNAVKNVFDKADTLAKVAADEAGNPTRPQVAKTKVAVASTSNLPLAPADPKEEPVAETKTTGVSPLTVGEVQAKLKVTQDSITSAKNELNRLLDKVFDPGLLSKSRKSDPHNLISSDRKIVNNPSKKITWNANVLNNHAIGGSRTGNIDGVVGFYSVRLKHLSNRRKEIESLISGLLASEAEPTESVPQGGVTGDKIEEAAKELIEDYEKTGEELEDIYTKAKKTFSAPRQKGQATGLSIVAVRDLGFVKQFRLSDGRVVRENELAALGLTAP